MEGTSLSRSPQREPWNKGKLVGQKAPFKPKDIWAMRMRLQQEHRSRDLALLNIGLDSKLRACDLVSLKVRDISHGEHVASRATVQQKKTKRPVQFEITTPAREAAEAWIREAGLRSEDYLSPAEPITHRTSAPGSTPASCASGCKTSAWTGTTTAPTRCDERRPR